MDWLQKNTFFYLFLLLICCLISYWPLTFNVFSLKNDALNYFLPVRFQISEAIQNGHWPLWSPYLNLGYPIHGDMISGVWSPFVHIFSLFGVYTLKMLQYETLLYVYISGLGMFFLLKHFIKENKLCLFGAAAYMLCGYISDSAQFLNWISSACFIPLIFLFYYRTLTENKIINAVYAGLFLFLMFTTAYPADFILMTYLIAALLIIFLFQYRQSKTVVKRVLTYHFILSIVFISLSLPSIISFSEFLTFSERGTGASFSEAMSNPLHPKLLFSFLTPLPIWRTMGVSITDPLERNCYFGLITFAFFLLSFFFKSDNQIVKFSKISFFVFLIFSFGEFGGLRVIAYYYLPLMDSFRHPANAKIFSIFFACILSTYSLQIVQFQHFHRRQFSYLFVFLLLAFTFLTLWGLNGPIKFLSFQHFDSFEYFKTIIRSIPEELTFSDLMLINIIIQIPFLILLILFLYKKIRLNFLIFCSVINSIIHVILFQPFTVVKKDSVLEIQNVINKVKSKRYPTPNLQKSLSENSIAGKEHFEKIGVSQLYDKKIGRVDYKITPSNLLTQNTFWHNESHRNTLMNYPLIYSPDTAIFISDTVPLEVQSSNRNILLTSNQNTLQTINNSEAKDDIPDNIVIQNFFPNQWDLKITTSQPGFYCIFQNYYPRWTVYINGNKAKPELCNVSFMGFYLSKGSHHVTFYYEATDIKITFILSTIILCAIVTFSLIRAGKLKSSYPS